MDDTVDKQSEIMRRYIGRTAKSGEIAQAAMQIYPSGVVHDMRYQKPYGIYFERGVGPRKWDIDGNEYIDYVGGHGSHIAGHNHPDMVKAVQDAIVRGTQLGGNSVDEVEYGNLIKELVPCAERVRLTMSGTEATLLALRLARAFKGKNKIIQVRTNFHGWHDQVASTYRDLPSTEVARGVIPAIADYAIPVPPADVDAINAVLNEDDDIAAVILEPTGTHFGWLPLPPGYLEAVREVTAAKDVLLILDEVITGFRVSPGGAQEYFGITPDLSTHAKIVAGGLPGGAVCGRKAVLDTIDFDEMARRNEEKVAHNGTYNGNLVSAAAGMAILRLVRDTDVCGKANAAGERLRLGLNQVIAELGMPWAAYGEFSGFFLFTNPDDLKIDPLQFDPLDYDYKTLKSGVPELNQKLVAVLSNNGVHVLPFLGGFVSAAHTDDVIDETVDRVRCALQEISHEL